jgi:hypothetical protein
MTQRDSESFDIYEDYLGEPASTEENADYDRFLEKVDRRVRPNPGAKKRGKAAWSKLEEVLADRKLEKDLRDIYDDES